MIYRGKNEGNLTLRRPEQPKTEYLGHFTRFVNIYAHYHLPVFLFFIK